MSSYIFKFKCSKCDTSIITQEGPKDHFFGQHTYSLLWEICIFCALQDIHFVHKKFTWVAFKISSIFIFFVTILLVIIVYKFRIMNFHALQDAHLKFTWVTINISDILMFTLHKSKSFQGFTKCLFWTLSV